MDPAGPDFEIFVFGLPGQVDCVDVWPLPAQLDQAGPDFEWHTAAWYTTAVGFKLACGLNALLAIQVM